MAASTRCWLDRRPVVPADASGRSLLDIEGQRLFLRARGVGLPDELVNGAVGREPAVRDGQADAVRATQQCGEQPTTGVRVPHDSLSQGADGSERPYVGGPRSIAAS